MGDELVTVSVKIFKRQKLRLKKEGRNISAYIRNLIDQSDKDLDRALFELEQIREQHTELAKRIQELWEILVKEKEKQEIEEQNKKLREEIAKAVREELPFYNKLVEKGIEERGLQKIADKFGVDVELVREIADKEFSF